MWGVVKEKLNLKPFEISENFLEWKILMKTVANNLSTKSVISNCLNNNVIYKTSPPIHVNWGKVFVLKSVFYSHFENHKLFEDLLYYFQFFFVFCVFSSRVIILIYANLLERLVFDMKLISSFLEDFLIWSNFCGEI